MQHVTVAARGTEQALTPACLQELTSLREQLLSAEVTTAGAVKEAAHLRQQLRSLQRTQSQARPSPHAELSSQVMPVIDLLMKDTYTALRDEFQSDVMYKVSKRALHAKQQSQPNV